MLINLGDDERETTMNLPSMQSDRFHECLFNLFNQTIQEKKRLKNGMDLAILNGTSAWRSAIKET